MKIRKVLIGFLIFAAGLTGVFFVYTQDYYRADDVAKAALVSDAEVQVTQTDYGWFFDGPSEENALVFYPGAKVEETAYAPFVRLLSRNGMDVCLVKMPFRLAIFGSQRAGKVMEQYSYSHWYIGGHSLGGAMAADYAARQKEAFEGVILCAAYPVKALPRQMKEILIYGSEDQVLNRKKVEKAVRFAPEIYVEHVIEGGNHAWFGSYGEQKGDGKASISAKEQWEEAVRVILNQEEKNGGAG